MSQLSDYSESSLRGRIGNYEQNSVSYSDTGSIRRVSYNVIEERLTYVNWWTLHGFNRRSQEKINHVKYFDINSGNYLGTNQNEAARNAINKGKEKFNNFDFRGAREQFHNAYLISTSQSSEEREGKSLREISDKVIEVINEFNKGNYADIRSLLDPAYSEAKGQMKTTIGKKRNEFAEKINEAALNKFEQGDWSKAYEFFDKAYMICESNYTNEEEFRKRKNIAYNLMFMNSSNELTTLTQALNSTQNQRMKNVLTNKINKLKQDEKEKQERADIERGLNAFANKDFTTAKNIFQIVYNTSARGSNNETTSKNYLDTTNMVLDGINFINSGNYTSGKEKLNNANNNTTVDRIKSAINSKKNEISETFNNNALSYFEQGNWSKAEELFNEAYLICELSYTNESEFKNRKNIAANLKAMNSSYEITTLTEALNSTQNQRMRQIISTKLTTAYKKAAEKNFNDAKSMWNQAWTVEFSERSNEANEKFNKAKVLFEKATQFEPQNSSYRNWFSASSLKITGNNEFNQGVQLQMDGEKLRNQSKYQEAKVKYELAQKKFEEGLRKSDDQRFQSSIDIARDQIKEIEALIQSQTGINTNPSQGNKVEDDNRRQDIDHTIEHN